MSRHRPALPTHRRSMARWWRRDPCFTRYLLREGTAVFIAAYALWLLAGLACLVHGEAAWSTWRALGASAPALLLHALGGVAALFHGWTWLRVLPKTLP